MTTFSISLPNQIAIQVDSETQRQGFATRSEFIRTLLRKYFTNDFEFKAFVPRPLEEIKQGMEKTGKYNKKFINRVIKGLSESSMYAH
ncbi:hypothetical protein HZC27_00450 [Candidatus Roizmanbacteria bacterium]|nr:hypothetical protein [Candidatus Roizmanbacteria bacterium]